MKGRGAAATAALDPSIYNLYFIAVATDRRGQGLGTKLIEAVERQVAQQGGQRLIVETSTAEALAAARGLYRKLGYTQRQVVDDFYGPGEGKVVFEKGQLLGDNQRCIFI